MTGAVGFIVGFLCIAGFAITASKAYVTVPPRKLRLFTLSFSFLAAAMLVWGFAIILNNLQSTKALVLASDYLLLLGMGCMIRLLFNRDDMWLTIALGVIGGMIIGLRAFAYPPEAFVQDGLLF